MTDGGLGYASLLTRRGSPHWVLFVMDFDWEPQLKSQVETAMSGLGVRLHFVRIRPKQLNFLAILSTCLERGLNPKSDYVSIQVLHCSYPGYLAALTIASFFPRHDLCRFELPIREMGFRPEHATQMIKLVCEGDYGEQEKAAQRFFSDLASVRPYTVNLTTTSGSLTITDDQPWAQIAGPLIRGERRLLPGGEVAYTGERINGMFTADGAILPTPQTLAAVPVARAVFELSRHLQQDPVTFEVESGQVMRMHSKGWVAAELSKILAAHVFREVTEVGVSFNNACQQFHHDWPAASNEGHPGIHIGIGGDPAPTGKEGLSPDAMVHVDFMAAAGTVKVNNRCFMLDGRVDV